MNIEIHLQNTVKLTIKNADYNPEEIAKQINSPNLTVVQLDDYIFNKHLISYVGPAPETTE